MREIGRGGMATVCLAEDRKHRRKVAVKVLRPELGVTVGPDRFLREIGIAARLAHPHILPVYDSGEADGLLYYVMPFVEGESLQGRLDRDGRLEVAEALHVAREVASALGYAHSHHVIHRDIKPANILLSGGHAVVTDFGVARAIGLGREPASVFITEPGIAVGTPTYMSPEQASGEQALDGRSDLYSLGCVLYETLVGEPPYTGDTPHAVIAQCFAAPIPSARRKQADVPEHVDAALRMALAKTPEERFATAEQFVEALTRPGVIKPPEPEATSIAVLPFEDMSADRTNEYLCDGMTEEIINALTKLQGLRVAARTSAFAFKGTNRNLQDVGAELGVSTILEGSVRQVGRSLRITAQLINVTDGYHHWSERYDRELEDVFAIQDEIAEAIASTLREHLVEEQRIRVVKRYTDDVQAYQLYLRGRYVEKTRHRGGFAKGIEYFEQAIARDPNYALAYAGVADSYNLLAWYRFLPPRDAFPKAHVAALKALEIDEMLAEAHTSLGVVKHYYDWDWQGAERSLSRALQLNPKDATALHSYSEYLASRGRLEEATQCITRAQELEPLGLTINAGLGWIHYFCRRYDEAIERFLKTIELDPEYVFLNWFLGQAYIKKGMLKEAQAVLRRGMTASGDHPGMAAYLAYAYTQAYRLDDARDILEALKVRAKEAYVPADYFAVIHMGLGELDAAYHWLSQACGERALHLVFLEVDPLFDDLRGDGRFEQILGRIGLHRG
ncbi:MAG: protein kinase [Gemmatimonadota bacterium]|nr:MAG: protein kinase [Gemmatimonadota bacterium]